ncbi:oligosaccharyltransferase complex subunit epsilon [Gnomoniopsis smithogilvyi]|uniref:Dolichyl-diphosphooligosaccharide--protein glycosyltransferase subunit OST2 n=1 Tax=Gnomoniopsis smithogilvyi TaxID=1191159 RepID=A0A9W8Z3R5_9PEZI|nr:oligosaccharyltransferase complex subunit epsilon [Gnomoniopsis smithogilvyi]
MAPKKNAAAAMPSSEGWVASSKVEFDKVLNGYWSSTNHQTKLIDVFLGFLVAVGAIQFLYFFLGSSNPFNAFLAGFIATVGQFVLTVSLRMQTQEQNKSQFPKVTPERSFADYIFGSLILHLFCVNYLN